MWRLFLIVFFVGKFSYAVQIDPKSCASALLSEQATALVHRAESNTADSLKQLSELARIPSVTEDRRNVLDALEWAGLYFSRMGFEGKLLRAGEGVYLYAESVQQEGKPTVLLYAHADVMPAGEGWTVTSSFEPAIRGDRVYGRGVVDDKAAIIAYGSALQALIDENPFNLPVNIRILIEGQEEIGSPGCVEFARLYPELFQGLDAILVADASNRSEETPTLISSLRGSVVMELEVDSSGAGTNRTALNALTLALGSFFDSKTGALTVDGIYDSVIPPSERELRNLEKLDLDELQYAEQSGLLPGVRTVGRRLYPPSFRIAREPAMGISFASPFGLGPDGLRKIPPESSALLTFELPESTEPSDLIRALKDYFADEVPWGLHSLLKIERETFNDVSRREMIQVRLTLKALEAGVHSGGGGGVVPHPDNALSVALRGLLSADDASVQLPLSDASKIELTISYGDSTTGGANETDGAKVFLAFRTSPGMNSSDLVKQVKSHLKQAMPWGVEYRLSVETSLAEPWMTEISNPVADLMGKALSLGFGKETLFAGEGGSIGLLNVFEQASQGAPVLVLGIEDPDSAAHNPNENLHVATFEGVRNAVVRFLYALGNSQPQ